VVELEGEEMSGESGGLFPTSRAKSLTNIVRGAFQNPRRILAGHVGPGMSVLDFGCGPGFFTIEAARLAGENGRVVAADLQPEMLEKLARSVRGTGLEKRILIHRCQADRIGAEGPFDTVLAIYVLHETPDQARALEEIRGLLKPGGRLLVVEPQHRVTSEKFEEMLGIAGRLGFKVAGRPRVFMSRAASLSRG